MEEMCNVLSDKQVDTLVNTMNESIEELPAAEPSEGIMKPAMVEVDPLTGEHKIVSTMEDPEFQAEVDKEFQEILDAAAENADKRDPVYDRDITTDDVKEFYKPTAEDSIINPEDLDPETIAALLKVANKKLAKEKFNAYREFPEKIQNMIDDYITKAVGATYNIAQIKQIRNIIADSLLEEFVTNISMNRASKDINTDIENLFNSEFTKIGNDIVGYTTMRNAKYREYAENVEDPEKKEKMLAILDRIDDAYNLDELIEFCKTCKIRSIDVEPKSLESHNYIMDSFMKKYETSQYKIYNLYSVEQVLNRRLIDENITRKHIRAFLLAFCKYCTNFTTDNLMQHIFMYYVVYNIMVTDINLGIEDGSVDEEGNPVEDNKHISDQFLDNVRKCINNLRVK